MNEYKVIIPASGYGRSRQDELVLGHTESIDEAIQWMRTSNRLSQCGPPAEIWEKNANGWSRYGDE